MTEAEWQSCDDPAPMLMFLRDRASDRKFRLFVCRCARRVDDLMPGPACRAAVGAGEAYADRLVTDAVLAATRDTVSEEVRAAEPWVWGRYHAGPVASAVVDAGRSLLDIAVALTRDVPRITNSPDWHRRVQSVLLGCIFGNPFRPVTPDPAWRTSTIVALASQMYESRDFAAMPILADALQDAGCEDEQVLAHCHGPGPHARGCWVVDLVLGKA